MSKKYFKFNISYTNEVFRSICNFSCVVYNRLKCQKYIKFLFFMGLG